MYQESKRDCEEQNSNVGKDVRASTKPKPTQEETYMNERIIDNVAHHIVESLPCKNMETTTNSNQTATAN